ncbi:hypothetical protein ACLOJK_007017 [Asimina triloba]
METTSKIQRPLQIWLETLIQRSLLCRSATASPNPPRWCGSSIQIDNDLSFRSGTRQLGKSVMAVDETDGSKIMDRAADAHHGKVGRVQS